MRNQSEVKHRGVFEREAGSGIWWIHYYDGQGRRHREKVGSKSAAMKLYQKRKTDVLEGKKLPKLRPRVVTFGEIAADALEYWGKKKSIDTIRGRVARLVEWWKDSRADSITSSDIKEKLSSVAAWTDSTRDHYRATLSRIYRLAMEDKKIESNPITGVERLTSENENARQGFVNDQGYSKLVANCPDIWLRTMLSIGYSYGWRAGELIALKVHHADLNARTLHLDAGMTKNGEARTVRLTNECLQLLSICITGKRPDDPIFARESGAPVRAYRFDWERLCVKAGFGRFVCRKCGGLGRPTSAAGRPCPDCRKMGESAVYRYVGLLFHDLRRSAVRNLERSSIPRSVAMKITGHNTESIYRRYAIVSESDMADAIGRLERMRLNSENEQPPKQPPTSIVELEIPDKVM